MSVKPTAVGLKLGYEVGSANVEALVRHAAETGNFVRIDMEDSTTTDDTLRMYRELREAGLDNVGVVLQARLRRTLDDIAALADLQPNVRICKGIYLEPEEIAFTEFEEIRESYVRSLEALVETASYVGIATHDEFLISEGKRIAKERYEFQMLLGVRASLGRELVQEGERLRIYVPFGRQWYEYSLRRLQENPRIAGLRRDRHRRAPALPQRRAERLARLARVQQEALGHARVVERARPGRELLERAHDEVVAPERADELTEPAEALREVVLAPVHQPVDAERGWVLVEEQEIPAGSERRGDRRGEVFEVSCALRRLGACVDEVEAAAQKLGGERVELAVDPEHRGATLARDGERAVRRVDAGDGCAELDELDGRGAGARAEMQDALAFEIRERLAHERGQRSLVALHAPVRGVERAAVLVGGLHAPTIARFPAPSRCEIAPPTWLTFGLASTHRPSGCVVLGAQP